jgi:hypothetical protein
LQTWTEHRELFHESRNFYHQDLKNPNIDENILVALYIRMILVFLFNKKLFLTRVKNLRMPDNSFLEKLKARLGNCNLEQRSYFLTGFQVINFTNESWVYWQRDNFLDMYSPDRLKVFRENYKELTYNILLSDPIKSTFMEVFGISEVDLEQNLGNALAKTYFLDQFCPGACGLTSYNLHIFIKRYSFPGKYINEASFAIIFIHEFCHYLRRVKCRTLAESKQLRTPETFLQEGFIPNAVSNFKPIEEGIIPFISQENDAPDSEVEVISESLKKLNIFKKEEVQVTMEQGDLFERQARQIATVEEEIKEFGKEEEFTYQEERQRTDAGFKVEVVLFSRRVLSITQNSSDFIVNYEKYPKDLGRFRKTFRLFNEDQGSQSFSLCKATSILDMSGYR